MNWISHTGGRIVNNFEVALNHLSVYITLYNHKMISEELKITIRMHGVLALTYVENTNPKLRLLVELYRINTN